MFGYSLRYPVSCKNKIATEKCFSPSFFFFVKTVLNFGIFVFVHKMCSNMQKISILFFTFRHPSTFFTFIPAVKRKLNDQHNLSFQHYHLWLHLIYIDSKIAWDGIPAIFPTSFSFIKLCSFFLYNEICNFTYHSKNNRILCVNNKNSIKVPKCTF